jgi:hypothetical protein
LLHKFCKWADNGGHSFETARGRSRALLRSATSGFAA